MKDFRSCTECGGVWFTLAPGEHGTAAGVVCLDEENNVTAWSGVLVCHACCKVADASPPSAPPLTLVPDDES